MRQAAYFREAYALGLNHGPGLAVDAHVSAPLRGSVPLLCAQPPARWPSSRHFGKNRPTMEPADPPAQPAPRALAPDSQTACYLPWPKVRVLPPSALSFARSPGPWADVHQHFGWAAHEQSRIRRAGRFDGSGNAGSGAECAARGGISTTCWPSSSV